MATTHHKPIKGARPTNGQHIRFLPVSVSFLFVCFLFVYCPAINADYDDLCQATYFHARRCPLRVLALLKNFPGVHSLQKPSSHRLGIEISSLNKMMTNLLIVHAISVQFSYIDAACQKNFNNLTKNMKNLFQGNFPPKTAPKEDFQPKQPLE
jgi:hypothetical protein